MRARTRGRPCAVAAAVVALATFVACAPAPAHAQVPDSLARCSEDAMGVVASRGGTLAAPADSWLMLEGENRSVQFRFAEADCMGLLVVGHSGVEDLDVVLHTESGIEVAKDVSLDRYAYVRYCGARGLGMAATVRMFRGRGEVRVLRFAHAPATLPDLNRSVGSCFAAAGGMRRPAANVGPELGRPRAGRDLDIARSELGEFGYSAVGAPQSGDLDARGTSTGTLSLTASRCYAVVASGGGGLLQLDIFVRAPTGMPLSREHGKGRAVLRFCADEGGDHVYEVRSLEGAGDFSVQAFELAVPAGPTLPGVRGPARSAYAETVARLARRGMVPRPVTWGWLEPGRSLAVPLELAGDHCYAVAAVPSNDTLQGDLDLTLNRPTGELIGTDLGQTGVAVVYLCPTHDTLVRARTDVYGARGKFLLLLGVDGREGATQP